MSKKRMPKEVMDLVTLLVNVTTTQLFHNLKKANPKVSDQVLTSVVIHAMGYANSKGLQIR